MSDGGLTKRIPMSNLVLEFRRGDVMIVNGAPIRFRTRSSIELTAQARFMFGKQIMSPDKVNSPARRIYFALQSAYIGDGAEREAGLASARHLIADLQEATPCDLVRQQLTSALIAAEQSDFYPALRLIRCVLQHEEVVSGKNPMEWPELTNRPSGGHRGTDGTRNITRPPQKWAKCGWAALPSPTDDFPGGSFLRW
jgi:flagellar biosynthesis repressor protein FlbT